MGRIGRGWAAGLVAVLAVVGAYAGPAAAGKTDTWTPTSTGTLGPARLGGVVTASQALARAQEWTTQPGTTYSQSGGWEDDATGGPYRRDCSGFVSMAWALTASLNTSGFDGWSGKTYLGSATAAAYERLRPGDALLGVDYGHIALFDRWDDAAHTRLWVYEETGTGHIAEHNETAKAWFTARGFRPIRYDRLRQNLAEDPAAPVIGYQRADGSTAVFRWASDGSSFRHVSTWEGRLGGPLLATGDVDGDGTDDTVLVANDDATTIWVSGAGGPPVAWYSGFPFAGATPVGRPLVGDFDGDGKADLAMFAAAPDGHLAIVRFLSTGTDFNIPTSYETTLRAAAVGGRIAAGDVDGDGTDDIVVAPQRADGTWTFRVFAGAGTPGLTWHTSGVYDLAAVGDRLVVGDFDGDGKAEPAMVADNGDGTMTIGRFMSTGHSFADSVSWHGAGTPGMAAAGDADGDGADDVVVADPDGDGTFDFRVFRDATNPPGVWYTSGPFTLANAGSRFAMSVG